MRMEPPIAAQDAPTDPEAPATGVDGETIAQIRRIWGFDTLRPMQAEAIAAGVAGRDSLLVMPTGGGKSLCYQVPPLVAQRRGETRIDVCVSPLIALMKDQVDGLRADGYPAAALHSGMDAAERDEVRRQVRAGAVRLLFVSPERVLAPGFAQWLGSVGVRAFAIDEAHCISQWGHDFRPEYRQLRRLREAFPEASFHACTATATPRVQRDIVEELSLRDPCVLVGSFDRPNLVYRIEPRTDGRRQLLEVLGRHRGDAVIVYCLSRRDTESLAEFLQREKFSAGCYHAGLASEERARVQEAFAQEKLDIVVATVAFGMGIDRSDVRAVVHMTMPKSVEHYQQETGRAGRDGLESECVLLHSYADVVKWQTIAQGSHDEARERYEEQGAAAETIDALGASLEQGRAQLEAMQRMASSPVCRHRWLLEHFGQRAERDNCGACDVCLGEVRMAPDSTTLARKLLSAVVRTGQRYGAGYVADVARGAQTEEIERRGHAALPTYGVLRDQERSTLINYLFQLVEHGLLARSGDEMPVLVLTAEGHRALRGEAEVPLRAPPRGRGRRHAAASAGVHGVHEVDTALFERLRALRREIAAERGSPPYLIFSDATLHELAAARPTTLAEFARIKGVGAKKLAEFGERFVAAISA
ncbi:MAG: RecQ family ATP-dependent DNA helicase [Phycisphaerales bacterium]